MAAEAGIPYQRYIEMDAVEVAYEIAGYNKRLRELTRISRFNAFCILQGLVKKGSLKNVTDLILLSDEDENTGRKWPKTTLEDAKKIEAFYKERDKRKAEYKLKQNAEYRFYQNTDWT